MGNDELKNLRPEERLKRLKALQEKQKKEIEEAQLQIQSTEQELREEKKIKEKVPIPEVAKEELEGLSKEGRELLKTHKGLKEKARPAEPEKKGAKTTKRETLEEAVGGESPVAATGVVYTIPQQVPPQLLNTEYVVQLSYAPVQELSTRMETLYNTIQKQGYVRWEQYEAMNEVVAGLERKIQSQNYTFTEEVAEKASLIQQLSSTVRTMYRQQKVIENVEHDWYKGR